MFLCFFITETRPNLILYATARENAMPLLTLENISLHYGEQIIFENLDFQLDNGDRFCIIGRNGVGKSTLLKTIEKKIEPDSGSRWCDPGVTIASLSQDLPNAEDITVYDFVAAGMPDLVKDLNEYQTLSATASMDDLSRLEVLQTRIEAADGWTFDNRIQQVLTKLDLDAGKSLGDMSGGWRRRVSLAQALVVQPDILLLDEPTNHLDIAAIQWLEEQLQSFRGAIVFITHDRAFLRAVANRIAELDRGHITRWNGDYEGFLNFKAQELETEAKNNALFDKKLAQEEVWIRQGIKARRTRNEGRVRALEQLRGEREQRRERLGNVKIEHVSDVASGKLVAELEHVSFSWPEKKIIDDFTSTIVRGDKVGLIGPNGIGKSTLLKIILGQLEVTHGAVRRGTKLSVAYFDQLRDQLDLEKSAIDNISDGRDFIDVNGRDKHIISYLQDFMFSGERARTPIKALSGGERNRILLAKLFSKPSNLLIMDEPTNDLDAETLELLEELLVNFDGTLLLVSHDRAFLDNVVTSSIAFEGNGRLREYVGGYSDWIRQGGVWPQEEAAAAGNAKSGTSSDASDSANGKLKNEDLAANNKASASDAEPKKAQKKLSYKLQAELDKLPDQLEKQEKKVADIQEDIAAEGFFDSDKNIVNRKLAELEKHEKELQRLFDRWEELSD